MSNLPQNIGGAHLDVPTVSTTCNHSPNLTIRNPFQSPFHLFHRLTETLLPKSLCTSQLESTETLLEELATLSTLKPKRGGHIFQSGTFTASQLPKYNDPTKFTRAWAYTSTLTSQKMRIPMFIWDCVKKRVPYGCIL